MSRFACLVLGVCVVVAAAIAFEFLRPTPLDYWQDPRTGLCFARYKPSLTHVPCTPDVLKLVGTPVAARFGEAR